MDTEEPKAPRHKATMTLALSEVMGPVTPQGLREEQRGNGDANESRKWTSPTPRAAVLVLDWLWREPLA
eukprot:6430249-Alexandrium_andersonii.AAC.1